MRVQVKSTETLESLALKFARDVEGVVRANLFRSLNISQQIDTGFVLGHRGRPHQPSAKRTPDELIALTNRIVSTLRKSPGIGIEEIANVMGCTTRELLLPISKLRMQKQLTTKGQKRAMRYTLSAAGRALPMLDC